MIRDGKLSDFNDDLLALFDEAYEETPFKGQKYKRTHVQRWFANACSFDPFFCKVVEENDKIVGILIGYISESVWGVPTAQSLVSYSRSDTHKLVRQFVEWGKDKGAVQVTVMTVPGKDRYEQLIKKLGFLESGKAYTLEV